MTLKDIAKLAGVSAPVVSVALSGTKSGTTKVTEETRERIIKIAKELNYKPDIFGRSLKMKKSLLIGVLLYDVNSRFFGPFIHGLQKQLSSENYAPIILSHATKEEQRHNLSLCLDRKVDGLIMNAWIDETTGKTDYEYIEKQLPQNLPLVEVYGQYQPGSYRVNVDNMGAFYEICSTLIQKGYRDIVMINHEGYTLGESLNTFFNTWQNFKGYQCAMSEHNLPTRVLTHPIGHKNSGWSRCSYELIKSLVKNNDIPDAIVCIDDVQAFGVIQACNEFNIKIPEDMAVTGFDDSPFCTVVSPLLTSCNVNSGEVGRQAGSALLKLISGQKVKNHLVKPEVFWREST